MIRSLTPVILPCALIILLLAALGGCAAVDTRPACEGAPGLLLRGFSVVESSPLFAAALQDADEEVEEEDESSTLGIILLYIPNRIFDLFDVARFGVNVGPGFGLDLRATKYVKLQFISDTSVGVGLQTLRHLPLCVRSQAKLGLGFISTPGMNLIDWHYGDFDLRVELYILIVGAHVAVEMGEIVDFIGGIFTWDPMHDDFRSEL
jgi:hypothetical protein